MKHDFTSVKNIYIICGTDMRKGIDGLATLIPDSFELTHCIYLRFGHDTSSLIWFSLI